MHDIEEAFRNNVTGGKFRRIGVNARKKDKKALPQYLDGQDNIFFVDGIY